MKRQRFFIAIILLLLLLNRASAEEPAARHKSKPRAGSSKSAKGNPVSFRKNPPKSVTSKQKKSKKRTAHKKIHSRPRGQMIPGPERTQEIQTKLIESGAMDGTPSGVWNPKQMQDAIRKFQGMKGLNATGKLDVWTLKAMGLK